VKVHRIRRLVPLALTASALLAALVPAVALACPIEIRRVGPVDGTRAELVLPTHRTVDRAAWRLDSSWVSTRPRLSQFVVLRGVGTYHGVSFRRQRALSIDAYGPFDNGWMYFDDADPDTPPCELTGQIEWQLPRIRVVQGRREVRIAATTQRTIGNRTGCVLGPDQGVRECPNLKRTIVRLRAPLGNRRLVFEQFP
jgi:hypothetical protein